MDNVKLSLSFPTIKIFISLYPFRHTFIFTTDGLNFLILVSDVFHDLMVCFHIWIKSHLVGNLQKIVRTARKFAVWYVT